MGFFKPTDGAASSRRIARVGVLIWVMIYAGLLACVMGLALLDYDAALAWSLLGSGGALTVLGMVLIYVRSRIED